MVKTTVLLHKKDGKTPFVTLKGKSFYIENVKYTDDVNILLNAINNVKPVDYNDLFNKNLVTKEEYWQVYFNHQWGNGGLILWHNPTDHWKCEQTRRGNEFCPDCKTKLEMYYNPYCPICESVKKVDGYYNLLKMIKKVVVKNGSFDSNNYWNFLCSYLDSIGNWGNDTGSKVNWKDVKEFCDEDWQREITDMFIKEYGNKTYPVWISW